ncbi:MAG: U32 family peptidase, partial [Spirochaetaceae bacterium]|nr:U32 family peptidase [Spirochaetaceae bacterium]
VSEIQDVRKNTSLELEFFVHGALCVSVSGLCLFSSFLGGKSANRGMCTQACRRLYTVDNDTSGYYFSPRDLQLLEEVKTIAALGINALKIEGRMKSAEYTGTVTAAYRRVLDSLNAPETVYQEALKEGLSRLRGDFARAKTMYLFRANAAEQWLEPSQPGGTGIPLGTIKRIHGAGEEKHIYIEIESTGITLDIGDSIRIHSAHDNNRVSHKLNYVRRDEKGYWLSAPESFIPGDSVYLIQKRAVHAYYKDVLPHDLSRYKQRPGFDKAPAVPAMFPKNTARNKPHNVLPEGIYAAVSCIEDLYIAQSEKPAYIIMPFNKKSAAHLLASQPKPLPFKSAQFILWLDPVVTVEQDEFLAASLNMLYEKGYHVFMANNLSQMALLASMRRSGKNPLIIAGPYLYAFNRYACSFITECGASYIVSPLENSRQNLEKTTMGKERQHIFITVFCHPPLFRFRYNIPAFYSFRQFYDSTDEAFYAHAVSGDACGTGAVAVPNAPFALTGKIPFMREAGFRRFILDFTGKPLKKNIYKKVWEHAQKAAPLGGERHFNWKNGFYNTAE